MVYSNFNLSKKKKKYILILKFVIILYRNLCILAWICWCWHSMTESYSNASVSSTSSLNSSFPDTEDDQTIASILAEEGNSQVAGRLGKRLSHLDSIPVFSFPHLYFLVHTTCLHVCVCVWHFTYSQAHMGGTSFSSIRQRGPFEELY
jgi:hypothetical protein